MSTWEVASDAAASGWFYAEAPDTFTRTCLGATLIGRWWGEAE